MNEANKATSADDVRIAVNAYSESIGLKYSALFVPQSKSRNANEKKPSLNWVITLERNGVRLVTDYMQGIGHVPGYPMMPMMLGRESIHDAEKRAEFDKTAETGKYQATSRPFDYPSVKPPALADVMYSLAMDSEVLDCGGFEGWAENFGYDTDSRSAEKTYRACVEIALKLRQLIGNDGIARFRELTEEL